MSKGLSDPKYVKTIQTINLNTIGHRKMLDLDVFVGSHKKCTGCIGFSSEKRP